MMGFFTPDQWIVLAIVLTTVVVINLILWLVALSEHAKNRKNTAHIVAAKTPADDVLDPGVQEEIQKLAKTKLEESVDRTAKKLAGDLTATSSKLTGDVQAAATKLTQSLNAAADSVGNSMTSMTDQMLEDELAAYRSLLGDARNQMKENLASVHEAMEAQRTKAEEEVRAEIREEKAELMGKFDNKLAEVLAAYLVESLGQNVDLGAQTKYIFNMLNEHKKQLKEDILSDF